MSQTKRDVRGAIDRLSTRGNIRCNDMIRLLEGLGFAVRDGKKTGHKVITHPELVNFTSASITCGHGRNPQVKPIYVARMRQLLATHADGLEELKEDRDDDNGESLRLQHHGPEDRL
ncbi:MAG: type II toxin-antitoxin system HicA family toxin [Gammaproteobacteria bacterium]|nr:type II toxin-antitoxin system HicA family toxin [Gammaproteobacteria bacterium]